MLINSTHSKNALSIGVATFDGLNENGFPYDPTNNSSDTLADVLTSKYFDLRGENNVFLSFYYQGGGLGEAPSLDDSLVVEFWATADSTWEQVWVTKGTKMEIFKRLESIHVGSNVFIAINGTPISVGCCVGTSAINNFRNCFFR